MIRVEAPSRLHFGLLALPRPGDSGRAFGGVGLMIDKPGVCLTVSEADIDRSSGPNAERALRSARIAADQLGFAGVGLKVTVERCPPPHVGLGVGTQIAMAATVAVARLAGGHKLTAERLAELTGRGQRSAVGVHGFLTGGLVVEGGKFPGSAISPMIGAYRPPTQWRVVLAIPRSAGRWQGDAEREAIAKPGPLDTSRLCDLLMRQLIPGALTGDFHNFSSSVHEYNRLCGEPFAAAQGGTYADIKTATLIHELRMSGVAGVGQSSWGPTVFALVESPARADEVAAQLRAIAGDRDVLLAEAWRPESD